MPQETDIATRFCLRGEQTVRTIAETHHALSAVYDTSCVVTIDASDVSEADLTAIQLIESVRRSAARDGKRLCMASLPSTALRELLTRGGFLESPDNALFWTAP